MVKGKWVNINNGINLINGNSRNTMFEGLYVSLLYQNIFIKMLFDFPM